MYEDLLREGIFKDYTKEFQRTCLKKQLSNDIFRYFKTQEKTVNQAITRLKNSHSQIINNFLMNNMGMKSAPKITTNYSLFGELNDNIIEYLLNLFQDIDLDRLSSLKNIEPKLKQILFDADNNDAKHYQNKLYEKCQSEIKKIEKKIKSIKQKILDYYDNNNTEFKKIFGSYSCYQEISEITINLFPCWLWAETTPNSDFESFLINTLSHERAHYYHHLGNDFDDFYPKYWFEICNFVIEGIAQYYSEEFAKSYKTKVPNILNDFNAFVNTLSPEEGDLKNNVYTWHKTWKTTIQVTQIALIKSRKQKNMDKSSFKDILRDEEQTYNKSKSK